MTEWTLVRIKKSLIEKLKLKAKADGRSLANYIEKLILEDLK